MTTKEYLTWVGVGAGVAFISFCFVGAITNELLGSAATKQFSHIAACFLFGMSLAGICFAIIARES